MPKALIIRSGSVRVRVFASRSGAYLRHEIRWTDHHGRRRRQKISNRAAALAEARRIADDLARGHHHSELTLADLASFRAAIVNLYGCGKTLELATAEYAECRKLLVGTRSTASETIPSLNDLAHCWLAQQKRDTASLSTPIAQLVETFLLQLKTRGLSDRHQEDLRARLRKYAVENPAPTADHTAATVQAWVLGLKVAARTRNNYLAAVQTLFADALLATHPHAPAIRLISHSKLADVAKVIWYADEMTTLLSTALRFDPTLVPLLVLGGFANLRACEALRAHAVDLRLKDSQMIVRAGSKTGSRLVPLRENAVAWLRACAPKDGPLWSQSEDAYHAHCRALAERCELGWRPNALRKSAQTYDMLMDPDYERVSAASGNSPKMMRKHYVDPDLADKSDALEWFAILPPKTRRVIVRLPQAANE